MSAREDGVPRPELPKRFFETVSVEARDDGFHVLLDGRPLRTPARRPFIVPLAEVAEAVAAEWRAQGERIDPATMPTTRLVNTTTDGISDNPWTVREEAERFVETDLLFYRAGEPEGLVERQREGWDPIVSWAEQRLGVRFTLAEGVMHVAQPERSIQTFREAASAYDDPFDVAAFHQMTALTGSALLAFAVMDGRIGAEEAWTLAHIDEDWNIETWGADEEAAARRAARHAEMRSAATLAGLR